MRPQILERVNPFIKIVTILICSFMMAVTKSWQLNAAITVVSLAALLVLSRCNLRLLARMFGVVLLLAVAIFFSGMKYGANNPAGGSVYDLTSMQSGLLLGTRILAYVSLGLLFALTTDQKQFVMSLMHQGHVKPKFAYGVLAAVNLVPTLRREWDEVNLAYRARQKKTGVLPLGPLFNTLVNGIRWSENVAMAMESKGFDGDGDRTFAMITRVRMGDICFAVICVALMTAGIVIL